MQIYKLFIFTLVFSILMNSTAFAESPAIDHSKMDHSKMGHGSMNMSKNAKKVSLKGKLIGLTCFLKHDDQAEKHKSCAMDCAKKGLPMGLLSEGKIYQISSEGHDSLIEAYKPLIKYLESEVMVKGELFEKNGIRLLVVKKIKKAAS